MNPELRRNLWLELSTHRLVAMPAVLFLVFVLFASRNVCLLYTSDAADE